MRCPRCGNDNAETNRFCGMCGASLVGASNAARPAAAAASSSGTRSPSPAPGKPAETDVRRAGQSSANGTTASEASHNLGAGRPLEPDNEPVVAGPSFLGLNRPSNTAESRREASRAGAQEHLRSSRNVDYLLEDEEEPRHGRGKLLLLVAALALAVGFGYLHWKQGGFDWVMGGEKKPSPTAASPDITSNAPQASSSLPSAATPGTPQSGAQGAPLGATESPSQQGSSASGTVPNLNASAETSSSPPPPASAPQANSPQHAPQPAPAPSESSPNVPPPSSSASQSASSMPGKTESNVADSDSEDQSASDTAAPKPKPRKPAAAVPLDTVAEAERYIYGRGVGQDCDHGLRLLKRATDQSNPKAMISMGSLYSTGTCTARDLPTAYRWFAMALHKEPDNQTLQNDLQALWSEMTQPERQLAIKLSQ